MKFSLYNKGRKGKKGVLKNRYSAKSFVQNLDKSIRKIPVSSQSETVDKLFKINDLVDLRMINNKTVIYVNEKRFIQCLNVLRNIDTNLGGRNEGITDMDQASTLFKGIYSQWFTKLSPEEEFMAHCSNIQAFFENDLNTDILHADVAFPLLRELVKLGYKPAENVFNKEIIKRYNHGTRESRKFLILEGYLKYLSKKEKHELKEDKHIPLLELHSVDRYQYRNLKKILDEYNEITQEIKIPPIIILEFDEKYMDFRFVQIKYPPSTLLDSDKILLFKDTKRNKMWLWNGSNVTTRTKYLAKKIAPKAPWVRRIHGVGLKLVPINEDFEPSEFKILVDIEKEFEVQEEPEIEQLEPLTREEMDFFLNEYKILIDVNDLGEPFERSKIRDSIEDEEDLFFALVEGAIAKIDFLMTKSSVDELTIPRHYLQEIFNNQLLKISDIDGYPEFKPGTIKSFELMGIYAISEGQVIRFNKIPADNQS